MNKNKKPILVVVFVIILIALILIICGLVKRYSPSKEWVDLSSYYGLTTSGDASGEAQTQSGAADTAIIVDNEILNSKAILSDGGIYIDVDTVQSDLNSRFYWDENEQLLIYTTPTDVIKVELDSTNYYISNTLTKSDKIILKEDSGTVYLSLDFIQQYTNLDYTVYEEPNRVVITKTWGDVTYATAKNGAKVRLLGGIKSDIVAELETDQVVTILEELDNWDKVATDDGKIGYVQKKQLSSTYTETTSRDFDEPEYTSIQKDFQINMVWHQVTNQSANDNLSTVLAQTKGVNVVSPTWFALSDNTGNISSLASSDYVTYAHENGIEVWALVSNFANDGIDTTAVLTDTANRERLESKLIAAAIEYKLDGINVDFESMSEDVGDSFIQFIRELSILCRKNGIVLSIDNYAPMAHTLFYNREEQGNVADYVILMGYDEHYDGSDAGSVASISWVEQGIQDTLESVPAEKLILGIPFYSRLWSEDAEGVSSTSVAMKDEAQLLSDNGATATWDDSLGQSYATFQKDDVTYELWVEDAQSIEEKLKLMKSYDLAGESAWKVGLESSDVWDVIQEYMQ